ncbi:MAG: MotA/TolQ/ExbB proton channel family protein [Thermoguttaceae bacterium]|nr:MotA/TolQ/ExbB proton channel family protein [Thermoguttaceae bacterium]MBR5415678.1 MotA/TolQ/ExbB proton channel family protein [Thermoguttaceae bacterium]MCR5360296.1 MotA/TolQ/ExbB proton channel family protein [Thermoguttaceae bacterium]
MFSLHHDFTYLDWAIVGFGSVLLAAHFFLFLTVFFTGDLGPHPRLKRTQEYLLLLSELLPLMGLLGTVQALLFTFKAFGAEEGDAVMTMAQMKTFVQDFAPALTTTANGLFFLIPNLLINALIWFSLPRVPSSKE